jgi:hypothetical protein
MAEPVEPPIRHTRPASRPSSTIPLIQPTLRSLTWETGYYPASQTPPKGLIANIEWTTSTLVDTSEDWVDRAVKRQWPNVIVTFNPLLPSDIAEDDLSSIPTLVQAGQQLAATLDWIQILGRSPGAESAVAH